jgi:hypothetical protein
MAFDPDKYLANQSSGPKGFDPDAYLGRSAAAPDRSFEVPTPENLAADRARPVQPSQPKGVGERVQEAAGNVFPMARSFSRRGAAELLGPSISALTTAGGAVVGTPLGPAGTVGGAGLGYGIGEEITRRIRGDQPTAPSQTLRDIATGATFEAGGRVAMPLIQRGTAAVSRGVGKISDLFDMSRIRAGRIARQAIGPQQLQRARAALQAAAGEDITAAQALARLTETGEQLNLPVAQALLRRAAERDPDFFTTLFSQQDMARLRTLEELAGGTNQTAANEARREMQKLLNERLIPTLKTEIEAANIAGRMVPRMQQQISDLEGAAAGKVEDVRRMTAAAERARATQEVPVPGFPRVSTQITYRGDLARAADQFAEDAAAGSLRLGEAARFKQAAMQSLEAHGQRPLTADSINRAIQTRLADPRLAPGNRDLQTALTRVREDIAQWTNADGIIDAWALDTIRKNSINAYVNSLPLNPKQARSLAADLTEQIRPVLIDAMETAGGTGYRQYLQDYARGMQLIGQSKLGAEAMKLYAENPTGFIKLVEGNDPKRIRQIFGPGSDNIFKELSANTQRRLGGIANELKREAAIDAQATAGEKALVDLMKDNLSLLRFPNFLNVYATGYNNAVAALEQKVGRRTLEILTEAAKSAKSFDDLLNVLPTADRNVVLRALQDPTTFQASQPVVGGLAAGVSQPARNPSPQTLNTTRMGGITNVTPALGAR